MSTVDEVASGFQTTLRCALVESPKKIERMVLHPNNDVRLGLLCNVDGILDLVLTEKKLAFILGPSPG